MVNARILEALGPDGYLINVARGAIVDEGALIAALKDRRSPAPDSTYSGTSRACRRS